MLEDFWVDHAATADFEPTALSAFRRLNYPLDINLSRWLSKREVRWTQTDNQFAFKEHAQEFLNRAFQIRKADAFINQQAFHLMEHR